MMEKSAQYGMVKRVAFGWIAGVTAAVATLIVFSVMIASGIIEGRWLNYGTIIVLTVSVYTGAKIVCVNQSQKILAALSVSGLLYITIIMLGLTFRAISVKGAFVTGTAALGACGVALLEDMPDRRRRKHIKRR